MPHPKISAALDEALERALRGENELHLRPHQGVVFHDRETGVIVLHWSRQIGKSFLLAAFAVDRAIDTPGHLVTVLSNSRENGAEFLQKCHEVCRLLQKTLDENGTEVETKDLSPDLSFKNLRLEVRFNIKDDDGRIKTSRIKVLAANPRTARGFSGDLILDEFAFHENSAAIWEAVEPILAANKNFLCRIASTGNGRHNMFYRIAGPAASTEENEDIEQPTSNTEHRSLGELQPATESASPSPMGEGKGEGDSDGQQADVALAKATHARRRKDLMNSVPANLPLSQAGVMISRVTRTEAFALGVKIFDSATRDEITPDQARAQALDKRAYDQNYECAFADENLTLLPHDLIDAAECDGIGEIAEQDWTASQLAALRRAAGPLCAGFDIARHGDLSVITVLEALGELRLVRAILRMRDLRLPDQQSRLGQICRMPKFQRAMIDMTGLGLGLYEFAQKEFSASRIHGINFASTVPATNAIKQEGRAAPTVRVTEALAMELLRCYEDRRIKHPADAILREDLRKPEKITTPGGRVSIAAARDEAGHADHFWSLALALEAAATAPAPFAYESIQRTARRTSLI